MKIHVIKLLVNVNQKKTNRPILNKLCFTKQHKKSILILYTNVQKQMYYSNWCSCRKYNK